MDSRDFFDKVALMRQLQQEYFRTREVGQFLRIVRTLNEKLTQK